MSRNKRSQIESPSDRWSWLWLVAAGLLGLVGSGKWTIPLATWFAPVFMLRFTRTQKPWLGVVGVFAVWAPAMFFAWQGAVPLPAAGHVVFAITSGVITALVFLADRLIAPRLPGFAATLVLPLAQTAWEFANASTSPYGSWGNTAYTQAGILPLVQLASVTGMWGLTFLIYWFGSTVNWAWEQRWDWRRVRIGAGVYAGVLLAVLLFGAVRLLLPAAPATSVRVATITPAQVLWANQTLGVDLAQRATTRGELTEAEQAIVRDVLGQIHDDLFTRSQREAQAGAQIVFWSEGAGMVMEEDEAALIARGQELARQEQIYLGMAMGVLHSDPQRKHENKIAMVDPTGAVVWQYHKHHPVAGGESLFFEQGEGPLPWLDTPYGRLMAVVCHDMDHHALLREAGQAGAGLLFVSTGDWKEVERIHLDMAVLRAVERGLTLVRPTVGISAAIDYRGRVLASVGRSPFDLQARFVAAAEELAQEDNTLRVEVPVQNVPTLYTRLGDAFGALCGIGLLAAAVWAVIRRFTA